MRLSPSLSVYIARRFAASVMLVFGLFMCVAFPVDLLNLGERAASREAADFGVVVHMALLKAPFLAQKALPFTLLFGAMLTYVWLTRTHELVVSRAAGVSAWQFLLPALALAVALGAFVATAFNPLAAAAESRFEQLENRFLRGQSSQLAVSQGGLWLREGDAGRQLVIHAKSAAESGRELSDVIVFSFADNDRFVERMDAKTAMLREGHWILADVLRTQRDGASERFDTLSLATELTLARIQNSFASPETLSFWELPAFIDAMEKAGFSALRHRIHWHAILSTPLLYAAIVLVAAAFSLHLTRRGRTALFTFVGIGTGFVFYFLSDMSLALGMSGSLPPLLAAWAPAGGFTMIGCALLFHMEDG